MDNQVRLKIVENASVETTPSKVNDIVKYMALDYVGLGENDKALAAIAKARAIAPKDFNLIINEANVYYQMGNIAKYTETVEEALAIEPNNAQLHFNVGTLSMDIDAEKAKKHLLKAIELKDDYAEAYGNLGNLVLNKLDAVQKEMDANAMNFAKYDEIKATKMLPILRESLPYLEKAYELSPSDFAKTQLNSLYENLEMDKKIE
jgi:tetratricopeptide (TPR) repeat protein